MSTRLSRQTSVLGPLSRSRARLITVVAMATALLGCSTLTPQIFSPSVIALGAECEPRPTPASASQPQLAQCQPKAPTSLTEAKAEAETLRARYLLAARDLSEVGARSSAALIGVSALALFKGITRPTSKDLAGLGIIGSGTYAYASTMTSRPRQLLYLEGAKALSCALTTASAYDFEVGWARGADAKPPSLESLVTKASDSSADLDKVRTALSKFGQSRTERQPESRTLPKQCDEANLVEPAPAASGASADERRLADIRRSNAARAREACAPLRMVEVTIEPHPDVVAMLRALARARTRIDQLVTQGNEQLGKFEVAPLALWNRTLSIQFNVAGEVLKTEPDITAVRAVASSLKPLAIGLAGSAAFEVPKAASAPADGAPIPKAAAQSQGLAPAAKAEVLKRTANRPDKELEAAAAALPQAETDYRALHAKLTQLKHKVDGVAALGSCGTTPIGAQTLNVTPPEPEQEVDVDKTFIFLISGGSGVPTGTVQAAGGGASRALPPATLESGRFKLVYTPPKDAKDGLKELISLSDGSALLHHVVYVTVNKVAAP